MNDPALAGYRVLVTRPEHQAGQLVTAIEQAGGEAVRFPVMQIVGRNSAVVEQALASLPEPDIAIFVSSNAVAHGLPAIRKTGATIAAVGPGTMAALEAAGVPTQISPADRFDSEGLLEHPALKDVAGKTIIIVRGESGRELLADTLKRRGAEVRYLSAYRREIRMAPQDEVAVLSDDLINGRIDCVTVMSAESLRNLLQQLGPDALNALGKTPLVAPGARVIQTVMELLPGVHAVAASGPQSADMLNALIETRHSGQN